METIGCTYYSINGCKLYNCVYIYICICIWLTIDTMVRYRTRFQVAYGRYDELVNLVDILFLIYYITRKLWLTTPNEQTSIHGGFKTNPHNWGGARLVGLKLWIDMIYS